MCSCDVSVTPRDPRYVTPRPERLTTHGPDPGAQRHAGPVPVEGPGAHRRGGVDAGRLARDAPPLNLGERARSARVLRRVGVQTRTLAARRTSCRTPRR